MSVGERLAVGRVRGIHGLRGALRVEILTDRPEDRFAHGATMYREGDASPLTVLSAHADEPGWLVRFNEIRDRAAGETLRDVYLEVEVAPGEELPRGEYYWHEVIGTPVTAVDGTDLGRVEDVYRVGAAEVFVVRGGLYGEFDLPAVRDFIRIFAPRRGEIVVDVDALELEMPKPPRPRGRKSRRAEKSGVDIATTDGPQAEGPPEAGTDAAADGIGPEVAAPEPAIDPAPEPAADASGATAAT